MNQRGFTLVEMLVALLIFGMIAAAGVGLLRFSVDAQAATKTRLEAMASERRIEALIASDTGQAVPRVTRNQAGDAVQAFDGGAGGFTLVRAGLDPLDDPARPSLQKVAYAFEGGRLTRQTWPMLDGTEPGAPVTLADRVAAVTLRYRSKDGWREVWDPIRPDLLPRAVEMIVRPVQGPEMRYLFLVGVGA
ncbi:general secretion pathway protein J [Sphingomonas changbaiensis NBRC 104936]|uniref:Type II secretion system protein J n=1 Tax=Sphingomonas changbaiensis NBRC 104936 TaxID=1219043 RepID=A0A0E9MMB4_9SPHN|nr:type II secretion system minor pseudopilin GspJ [Sphingomonas changbaiensis]GAO38679.1 general secretion pathway protein J [Sphingomonas changbaiensis NBRC 104936]